MESYDMIQLKENVSGKADKHEVSQVISNVSGLMDSVGMLSTVVDGLRIRIETLENAK